MSLEAIFAAIPHREPFLFIENILECTDNKIVCERTFADDEDFFRGHYPASPVVPGVILCEAGMQAGAILLSHRLHKSLENAPPEEIEKLRKKIPVVVRMNDIRFRQIVRPGDSVRIEAELEDIVSRAYKMKAVVFKNEKPAVRLTYVVMLVDDPDAA